MKIKKKVAAGGIVFDVIDGILSLLIIRQASHGDWVFPKGHLDPGEGEREGAIREVAEETGLSCEITGELGTTSYSFTTKKGKMVDKVVHWYLMKPVGHTDATHAYEVLEQRWVPLDEVEQALTYESDRRLVKGVIQRDLLAI